MQLVCQIIFFHAIIQPNLVDQYIHLVQSLVEVNGVFASDGSTLILLLAVFLVVAGHCVRRLVIDLDENKADEEKIQKRSRLKLIKKTNQ